MKKKQQSKVKDPIDFNKHLLQQMFDKAFKEGKILWPDDAVKELMSLWDRVFKNEASKKIVEKTIEENAKSNEREKDFIAEAQKAHIDAVNLFYRTYFPRRGAPRIQAENIARIMELHRQGKSYRSIALEIYPELDKAEDIERAAERIRKRITTAEKQKD